MSSSRVELVDGRPGDWFRERMFEPTRQVRISVSPFRGMNELRPGCQGTRIGMTGDKISDAVQEM